MSNAVKVYSNALFQLSIEENLLDTIHSDLKSCADIFSSEPEFLKILSSPVISIQEKTSMLEAVFKDNCNQLVFNFMCLLAEKGRIGLFIEIQKDFAEQYNLANNVLEAEVITYIPLSDELRKKVIDKLQVQTGKNVTIIETIDKSILGGIVIKYDNTIIDDSVKTKLKRLSKQLHEH
jgi:F-type H+-transporting ATPase subunit delta